MFPSSGYSIQEFFICYFYCQKSASVCGFQHTLLWKLMIFSRFMRFCGHVFNSPRNKSPKRLISYLLEKVVFLDPKRLLSPWARVKKTFSSTLNVMILQIVRNGSVRFGRHIDIKVSYKILWLQVPKLVPILYYPACFQKGLFGGNLEQKHPLSFRG
jgi:hypothetical protein